MPVIVTLVPVGPDAGERLVILGVGRTVKATPLLGAPDAVMTMFPVVAPDGTDTTTVVLLQLLGLPTVPLNLTLPLPWVAPKFAPLTVTEVPTRPEVGETLVIAGAEPTTNEMPLLATPETVTTALPVVAPVGTTATMLVALQLVAVAAVPLKVIALLPWLAPKFVPVTVTDAPGAPDVGLKLVILGVGSTVNVVPLLVTPATVTVTFPLVAPAGTGTVMLVLPQVAGVPVVPLNCTVP